MKAQYIPKIHFAHTNKNHTLCGLPIIRFVHRLTALEPGVTVGRVTTLELAVTCIKCAHTLYAREHWRKVCQQ